MIAATVCRGDQRELEFLMQSQRCLLIAGRIDQQRQGELRRSAAAIAPLETGGRMIGQVETLRQARAVAVLIDHEHDGCASAVAAPDIGFRFLGHAASRSHHGW